MNMELKRIKQSPLLGDSGEVVMTDTADIKVKDDTDPYVTYKGISVDVDELVPNNVHTAKEGLHQTVYKDVELYLPK